MDKHEFIAQIARMETEDEINERTDDEGMSGDDACSTLSSLIEEARDLLKPTYTLANRIATLLQAILNCENSGNSEWMHKHRATLCTLVREHMPSGSGFDGGTSLDEEKSTPTRLVFYTAFHHMNDRGEYVRWSQHAVIVKPTFIGADIRVTGRNVNDIKDYIAECFASALATQVTP